MEKLYRWFWSFVCNPIQDTGSWTPCDHEEADSWIICTWLQEDPVSVHEIAVTWPSMSITNVSFLFTPIPNFIFIIQLQKVRRQHGPPRWHKVDTAEVRCLTYKLLETWSKHVNHIGVSSWVLHANLWYTYSVFCNLIGQLLWNISRYTTVWLRMRSRPNLNGKETTVDTIGSHTQR